VCLQRELRRGKLNQSCSRSQKGSVCSRPFEDPAKAVKELIHLESESEKLIHSQPGINTLGNDQLVIYLEVNIVKETASYWALLQTFT
jgi:hypothetical protein